MMRPLVARANPTLRDELSFDFRTCNRYWAVRALDAQLPFRILLLLLSLNSPRHAPCTESSASVYSLRREAQQQTSCWLFVWFFFSPFFFLIVCV
jgi:hypothetical protein